MSSNTFKDCKFVKSDPPTETMNLAGVMKFIDIDTPLGVPANWAVCPICGAALVINELTEWDLDEQGHWQVTRHGFNVTCITEPKYGDPARDIWWKGHHEDYKRDWVPVKQRVWEKLTEHYRFVLDPPGTHRVSEGGGHGVERYVWLTWIERK